MRSLYSGRCTLCHQDYPKEAQIGRWLDRWAHQECKDQAAVRIASEGRVTALQGRPARGAASPLRPKRGRTRGIRQVV